MVAKEYLTETIKYTTEMFRLVWISILAIGSGVIGLLLGKLEPLRLFFILAGIGLLGILSVGLYLFDRRIRNLLDRLKEV